MAKRKTDETATGPDALDNRIALFFSTQPFGHEATASELMVDLTEKELEDYVSKDETESILKRLENDKIQLPKAVGERKRIAQGHAIEHSLARLVKEGTLEKVKVEEPGGTPTTGYRFTGKRDEPADETEVSTLPIDRLKIDPKNYQARSGGINQKVVDRYAATADRLPAIDAWDVGDDKLIVTDGFHRVDAFRQAGIDMIPVRVHKGTKEEAKLHAIRANRSHGYARTMEDIKAATGLYLMMPGNRHSSVAAVAKAVDCAWSTANKCVSYWRKQWGQQQADNAARKEGAKDGSGHKEATPADQTAPHTPAPSEHPTNPTVADSGIKDKLGNPVPNEESLVRAFTDTRFKDAVNNILSNVEFLRNLRMDGYTLSTIQIKERSGILNEVEWAMANLQKSVPFALTPQDAGTVDAELKKAVRRGWMDKAEFDTYVKKGGKGAPPVESGAGEDDESANTSHVRGSEEGNAADNQATGETSNEPATAA